MILDIEPKQELNDLRESESSSSETESDNKDVYSNNASLQ